MSFFELQLMENHIELVEKQLAELVENHRRAMGELSWQCSHCSVENRFNETDLIDDQWHVPPHGCTGGDYMEHNEYQATCQYCSVINRFHFRKENMYKSCYPSSVSDNHLIYNRESAFFRKYTKAFRSVSRVENNTRGKHFVNNPSLDQNLEKFLGERKYAPFAKLRAYERLHEAT